MYITGITLQYVLNAYTDLCTILLDGCKCLQINTKRLSIV